MQLQTWHPTLLMPYNDRFKTEHTFDPLLLLYRYMLSLFRWVSLSVRTKKSFRVKMRKEKMRRHSRLLNSIDLNWRTFLYSGSYIVACCPTATTRIECDSLHHFSICCKSDSRDAFNEQKWSRLVYRKILSGSAFRLNGIVIEENINEKRKREKNFQQPFSSSHFVLHASSLQSSCFIIRLFHFTLITWQYFFRKTNDITSLAGSYSISIFETSESPPVQIHYQ